MKAESLAARLALAAAIVGGVSYLAADHLPLTVAGGLAWKGCGVGLLALYAALRAETFDGWLLTAVMALGAAGDVLLGAAGFAVGGGVFLLGHLVAIWLYLRNRRPGLSRADWASGLLLVPVTVTAAWLLPADRAGAVGVAVYALGLSTMAATAGLSAFPRGRVALGALMFLVSDLLIFARAGPLAGQATALVGFLVWSLYFAGQALICLGVTRTLAAQTLAARGEAEPG
jgi:uncharacterized membrane protein YhhN